MNGLISLLKLASVKRNDPGSVPIVRDRDQYHFVRVIGSGSFGIARLMWDKQRNELFAIKHAERGFLVSSVTSFAN